MYFLFLIGSCPWNKIELKVFIHCCDGCKKKVKKVLSRMEGVYKTQLDPTEPKVTVLGNVETQALIKKLLKYGKHAEIWGYNNQIGHEEEKDVKSLLAANQKGSSIPDTEQTKYTEDKLPCSIIDKEGKDNTAAIKKTDCMENTSSTGLTKSELKPITEANIQYYYMLEPRPIIVPYCTTYPYTYSQELYDQRVTCQQPLYQAPITRAGDYFSDENSAGCHVM
ncbi:hypothetical protein DCAR_0101454 [Daucus carota subsp. sativus]|uniref:HMA domain-containing protein n=1 Tax=Daucus carota subsp. sativus TaxID=79200 RepID=A0AAF1AJA5_DAUCS|nr:hypothetical protein DCAR_0101454 [Daucus carota subsp. sativus]